MLILIPAGIIFLVALLAVVKAPSNLLWRLQVGVTEFPHVFVVIGMLLLAMSFVEHKFQYLSVFLSSASVMLFIVPIIRVHARGRGLKNELLQAFPIRTQINSQKQPFSLGTMLTGIKIETRKPSRHVYRTEHSVEWDFDFYASDIAGPCPCVVVVHSGSWSSGDNKEFPALNSYFANQGYHVAAIIYRLAPEFKSPSQVDDVRALIHYLKTNATRFSIDNNRFVLLGRSAGGQIALCAAYTLQDASINGVISFYAPADMVWGASVKGNPWVLNTEETFAAYLGGAYDEFAEKYHESSAYEHATRQSPPTLIIHGTNDCMVSFEHSRRLNEKLTDLGVPHYLLDIPGATHACDYNLSGPGGQLSTFAIERFIASVVNQ